MISFADLTKQVHSINDLILSDMVCDQNDPAEEEKAFSKHLLATKTWFARISYMNKKRYLLVLLQDMRSAWTLSVLLKAMWNCRPKDAVMSVSERSGWLSSYDEVPMDHNRTALPVITLALAMKNDRIWFLSLGPEDQALVLSELLTIAGGPAMWEVLRRAQMLYERYQAQMLQSLRECIVIGESYNIKSRTTLASEKSMHLKKDRTKSTIMPSPPPVAEVIEVPQSKGQKNMEANLAIWNATIKAMRDSLKLEELEMTFNDGTKRKIWKVNRVRPDVMETVDFVQLLPSAVGKRILSFLPRPQLGDYAKVNKYWAYLVDEYRSEMAARAKIDSDYERLEETVLKHDESMYDFITQHELYRPLSSAGAQSKGHQPIYAAQNPPSVRASEKSGGAFSLRYFSDKLNKPMIVQKPIRNLAELNERMEIRGATDEHIWKWCENIIAHDIKLKRHAKKAASKGVKKPKKKEKKSNIKSEEVEGLITLGNTVHFPCPLMKHTLEVPLNPPLYKDPALVKSKLLPSRSISNATLLQAPKETYKRFNLWTRDVSPLYPVFKIPSYHLETL